MKTNRIKTVPDLVVREFVALLLFCSILLLTSTMLDAPICGPANVEGAPMENVKAPWIFVGIQQMLKIFSPDIGGIILPGMAVALLALGPIFIAAKGFRFIIFFGVMASGVILTVWGYLS